MENKEYVRKIFASNPFVMKSLERMKDLNEVDKKILNHIKELINHKKTKKIILAYNNYDSVFKLYDALLEITKKQAIDLSFASLDFNEKINILEKYKIKYEITSFNNIIIFPKNFLETSKIGSSKWCITKRKSDWYDYNGKRKFIIVITKRDMIGCSYDDKKKLIFDKENKKISFYLLLNRSNYDKRIEYLIIGSKSFNKISFFSLIKKIYKNILNIK